jgi:hypothetical protein
MAEHPAAPAGMGSALLSLLASSSTLVCCALPALLVALGAGTVLASLVAAVPGLVWFSEHKAFVFAAAGIMLVAAGLLQWRTRTAPCPVDPVLRRHCLRTRRNARLIHAASIAVYALGGWVAFGQPLLGS